MRRVPGFALLAVLVLVATALPGASAAGGVGGRTAAPHVAGCAPSIAKNVSINLTNTAPTPTGVFEISLFVNSGVYAAYINSSWSNVEFVFGNGTPIQAWVESGATNRSTDTEVWLHLFSLGSKTTLTVYMDILTGCGATVMGLAGPTGEAPQLSDPYGSADNGWRVFLDFYDNFSGHRLKPALWTNATTTVGGNAIVADGLTITEATSSASRPSIYSQLNFTGPEDVEWFGRVPSGCTNHVLLGMGWDGLSVGKNTLGAFCDAGTDQFEQHLRSGGLAAGLAIPGGVGAVFRLSPDPVSGRTCFWTDDHAEGCGATQTTGDLRIVAGDQHAVVGSTCSATWVRARANVSSVVYSGLPVTTVSITGAVHGVLDPGVEIPVAGANVSVIPTEVSHRGPGRGYYASTDPRGEYTLTVPANDSYTVFANRSTWFGGDSSPVDPFTSNTVVNLREYPFVGFGNATFRLPRWNTTAGYTSNCNQAAPCRAGKPAPPWGYQQPVLGWTSDTVYYVDNTSRLIGYSLVNSTPRVVAPWLPLHENVMFYNGVENTFWLTEDDEYAYAFGCLAVCTNASTITAYAVNVTTGRVWEHNFTGVTDLNFLANGEVLMLGENGNYSLLSVITASGTILSYDLWTGIQATMTGPVGPFEANNLYWLPQINSLINVVADSAASDEIVQYRLTGPAPGTTWMNVATLRWSSSRVAVQGAFVSDVNVTAHTFVVSEAGPAYDYAEQIVRLTPGSNGTMKGFAERIPFADQAGSYPNTTVRAPLTTASEHRPGWIADTPAWSFLSDNGFQNDSALVDPSNGMWYDTNLTWVHNQTTAGCSGLCYQYRQGQVFPSADEGLFFNTSYAIQPQSYDCRTNRSSCPTSDPGTAGEIYYAWRLGQSEFPYPASAAPAQPCPPSPVNAIGAVPVSPTSERITWQRPTSCANPITNYTLFWGAGRLDRAVDLYPANRSVTLPGLTEGTTYDYAIEAWNLHWHGSASRLTFVAGTLPHPPTGLAVTGESLTTVTLGWTNPGGGGLVNDTIYLGTSCGTWTAAFSTGGVATGFAVSGLSSATRYCFSVSAWNGTGQSSPSVSTNGTTVPDQVTNVAATAVTASSLVLTWVNPTGSVRNDSIAFGTSCASPSMVISVGYAATSETITGLSGATAYCFVVAAWSDGGSGPLSGTFNQTTVPDGVLSLAVASASTSAITLSWSNPSGAVVNDTVFVGTTCAAAVGHSVGLATSFQARGLASATTYCFLVSPWSAAGPGNATYANGTSLPGNVSALAVTSVGPGTTVGLAWTNPNGTIVNDTVLAGPTCGAWTVRQSTAGATGSGTASGLANGTSYCFAVLAWSLGGNGSASAPTTDQTPAPTSVRSNRATPWTASVQWTPPWTPVFRSTVRYGTSCSGLTQNVTVVGPAANGSIGPLVPGTTYCVVVADRGYAGWSSPSATANVTAPSGGPVSAPVGLRATTVTTGSVSLVWKNPPGRVDNVTVWFGTTCAPTNRRSVGPVTNATVGGLLPSTSYCFEVQAWQLGHPSVLSAPATATTRAPYPRPLRGVAPRIASMAGVR